MLVSNLAAGTVEIRKLDLPSGMVLRKPVLVPGAANGAPSSAANGAENASLYGLVVPGQGTDAEEGGDAAGWYRYDLVTHALTQVGHPFPNPNVFLGQPAVTSDGSFMSLTATDDDGLTRLVTLPAKTGGPPTISSQILGWVSPSPDMPGPMQWTTFLPRSS